MVQSEIPGEAGAGEKRLSSAIALVTGGSRGIGRAIATRLARLGASVAICGRDAKALSSAHDELAELEGAYSPPGGCHESCRRGELWW